MPLFKGTGFFIDGETVFTGSSIHLILLPQSGTARAWRIKVVILNRNHVVSNFAEEERGI
jgi:hypothetical protein